MSNVATARSFKEIADIVVKLWATPEGRKQAIFLPGPPGVGKTALCQMIADRMAEIDAKELGIPVSELRRVTEILDLTSRLPEDIGGLPFRDGEAAMYAHPAWAIAARDAQSGVVCFDDLPAAMPSVANATRQCVLDRKVHGCRFSDRVGILVTGNRREDKSNATELPAHFRNTVLMLSVEPNLDQWQEWYTETAFAKTLADGRPSLDLGIIGFLRFKPAFFSQTPAHGDSRGSFATPRTWHMLGRAMAAVNTADSGTTHVLAHGLVGEGPAVEYAAFQMIRSQLPDMDDLFDNYKKHTAPSSKETDKLIAILTAIAEVGIRRHRAAASVGSKDPKVTNKTQNEIALHALRAMAHLSAGGKEYIGHGAAVIQSGISTAAFLPLISAIKTDPELTQIRSFVKSAFKGS